MLNTIYITVTPIYCPTISCLLNKHHNMAYCPSAGSNDAVPLPNSRKVNYFFKMKFIQIGQFKIFIQQMFKGKLLE